MQKDTNDIVIDANVLFAALIKDNITRFLLVNNELEIFVPEYIFLEVNRYFDEICKKSKKSKEDLAEVLSILIRRTVIVPQEELRKYLKYARTICPDEKDVPYFALALKLKCAIWSNDKALKTQKIVKIYSTDEIKKMM